MASSSAMVEAQRRRLTVGMGGGPGGPGGGPGGLTLAKVLMANEAIGKVTCIHSTTDSELKRKRSFAEKDRVGCANGEAVDDAFKNPPSIPGVNATCRKGLKPESPNQDSFVVVKHENWTLFGVFDGHGPNGHDVSDFAVKTLVTLFFDKDFKGDTGKAFTESFVECQRMIEAAKSQGLDSQSSGSTCTMAFHNVETDELTIAHAGDSRAVLYEGAAPGVVLCETEDHKPNLPAEKARIEKCGGRVVFDGYYNYRVFAKAGMYPGLNMSRALGDVVAHKEAGLTAEPEVHVQKLKEKRGKPLTLLICSDGVWEFIKSEEALCPYIAEKDKLVEPDNLQKGVEKLAKKSWDQWMEDSDNEISDDITALAIIL